MPIPQRGAASRHAEQPQSPHQSDKRGHRVPSATANPRQSDDGAGGGGGTGKQVNQTFAIAMMACPANPLPFPLPIPVGIAMLLGPSGGRKS